MAWVEKDRSDHPVSTPLPQAGSPTVLLKNLKEKNLKKKFLCHRFGE